MTLEVELSGETFGITIKRHCREEWEPLYVAVIDCRGDKGARVYYTKWHEIAHVLTLTDETRTCFKRTHSSLSLRPSDQMTKSLLVGGTRRHQAIEVGSLLEQLQQHRMRIAQFS